MSVQTEKLFTTVKKCHWLETESDILSSEKKNTHTHVSELILFNYKTRYIVWTLGGSLNMPQMARLKILGHIRRYNISQSHIFMT